MNNVKKVFILSGVSGSGKSTYAKQLIEGARSFGIGSADDFFMKNGVYLFDPAKLPEAHNGCFRAFITKVQMNTDLVVVDNTNTTVAEIAPYVLGATAFGYEAEILTFLPSPKETSIEYIKKCAARNKHGVSLLRVQAQLEALTSRQLPSWWKETPVFASL